MSADMTVRVRGPEVVLEEIEGEVIAINLDTGAYFSFRDSAASVWSELMAGESPLERIVDALEARFAGERDEVKSAVSAFLRSVEAEGLVAIEQHPADVSQSARPVNAPRRSERPPFSPPVFEKYTDMQEFLLVDPIHEVDVSRWPDARGRP